MAGREEEVAGREWSVSGWKGRRAEGEVRRWNLGW